MNEMWVDKYRPNTIDEMVLSEKLKTHFKNMITSGNISNMLLSGPPGIGKTTLAMALVNELNMSVLFVKCGENGTIDTMRTQVKDFAESLDIDDRLKCVLLDESDSLSGSDTAQLASSAQKSLRSLIEANQSDTRFILTANYENKIIGPIKSRCPLVRLNYTAKDLIIRLKHILDTEKIIYTNESLKEFATTVIKSHYPDIRKIITHLQNSCVSGKLQLTGTEVNETEIEAFASNLYKQIRACEDDKALEIRRHVIHNKTVFDEDFSRLAGMLLNTAAEDAQITPETLSSMINGIYQLNNTVDPEIAFYGILLMLISK
jgi:DNA polymerase III delta prime subunit